jgi:calpain-7
MLPLHHERRQMKALNLYKYITSSLHTSSGSITGTCAGFIFVNVNVNSSVTLLINVRLAIHIFGSHGIHHMGARIQRSKRWSQSLKMPELTYPKSSTTASLKLETTLPHTLPNLSQRIFPSYIASATQWSNLLASGLVPNSTGIQQLGSDIPATKQEAIKKWRMCLERADLVKKKVAAMGGQVGKPVDRTLGTEMGISAKTDGDSTELATQTRRKRDEAEQISILRRSSTIRRHHSSIPVSKQKPLPQSNDSAKSLHLPLWHDADATFLAPLTIAQVEQLIVQPDLSPDQRALHATWENIYNPANPFVDFTPCLPQSPQEQPAQTRSIKVEQGIGANCSVIAGLNALVAHNARWGTALGMRNFVPIRIREKGDVGDEASRVRYWRVKVFVNGAWRSVS